MYGIKIIKCDYCQEEKAIKIRLQDYVYKRRLRSNGCVRYFCGYNCMVKAERENPNKYYEGTKIL